MGSNNKLKRKSPKLFELQIKYFSLYKYNHKTKPIKNYEEKKPFV